MEKDYLVEVKSNMLNASALHKEGNKYIHKVRKGRSYDRVAVDPNEVYTIERYYRKNKTLPGLTHMVAKIKNATKVCYEKYFCTIYRSVKK